MQKKPWLFLVEDDQSFGAVLKSYLEINDFEVTWSDDGKYAADRFRHGNFDLCFPMWMDIPLPPRSGKSTHRCLLSSSLPKPFVKIF